MLTSPFQAFSEADWDTYQGAEKFSDGSAPIIADFNVDDTEGVVIVDAKQISVLWTGSGDVVHELRLPWPAHRLTHSAFHALGLAMVALAPALDGMAGTTGVKQLQYAGFFYGA